MNTIIVIKTGGQITPQELEEINKAKAREWNLPPMDEAQKENSIFVLVKDLNDSILAQGQLLTINGVKFNNETFSIIGIGGIIANEKGQGYGRRLMEGIIKYLVENKKTGVGFTADKNIGFYKKCGFLEGVDCLSRFIHMVNNLKIINATEDCVFYLDSDDKFMEKVLANPDLDIFLLRDPDW